MDSLLKLAPCTRGDFHKDLADLIAGAKLARLGGPDSASPQYWIVTGRLEKRALMGRGVSLGQVWTLDELRSVGVELTLAGVMRAFGLSSEGS